MTNVKENVFFNKLRQLSRDVTSTSNTLKSRVSAPPKEDFSSAAVLKLQQVKKEVKELKKESSDVLSNFQRQTSDFDTLLKTCQQFLEFQQNAAVEIEGFLHQYGYTTWAEKASEEAARAKAKHMENQPPNEEVNETSTVCQTPEGKPASHNHGTPKLEDLGLSDYTMQALFRKEVKPVIKSVMSEARETASLPTQEAPLPGSFTPRAVQNLTATTPQCKPSESMCGTPDLRDYGLNEHTLQSLNLLQHKPQLITDTPQHVKQDKQNYNFGTPVPEMFVHNGIIVTPGFVNGRPLPTETPSYHIGGIKGFEKRDNKQLKPKDNKDYAVRPRKTVLKLEDYWNSSESQAGAVSSHLPPKRSFVSSRFMNNSEIYTPPEPELLSSRLQMIQKESENRNVDLFTPSKSGKTLETMACITPRLLNKGDNYTPPEPELLTARLTKQKAAVDKSTYNDFLLKDQPAARDTSIHSAVLPKPVGERAYCFSDVPAPPKLMGRYQFANDNSENIPPS